MRMAKARHGRVWSIVVLAALAACGTGDGSEGFDLPAGMVPAPGSRRFVDGEAVLRWKVGGSGAGDTTVISPAMLVAAETRTYVYDFGSHRILVLNGAGDVIRRVGRRGSGPGELRRVAALGLDEGGGVIVLDPENSRITRVDTSGEIVGQAQVRLEGYPAGILEIGADSIGIVGTEPGSALMVVDRRGKTLGRSPFPWADAQRVPTIARQAYVTSDGHGNWVFAYMMAGAWFPFSRDKFLGHIGSTVGEARRFPAVKAASQGGGVTYFFETYTPCSTCDASMDAGRLFLLAGGSNATQRQVVDVYDVATGRYEVSFRLPQSARFMSVRGDRIVMSVDDPYPAVIAYDLPRLVAASQY